MAENELPDSATDLTKKCHQLWGGYCNKNERIRLSEDQEKLRKKIITTSLLEPNKISKAFNLYPSLLYTIKTTNEDIWYEGLLESAGNFTWKTCWGILYHTSLSLKLYKIKANELEFSELVAPILGSEVDANEKKLTVKIENKVYKFRASSIEECEEWEKRLRDVSSSGESNIAQGTTDTQDGITKEPSCSDDQNISEDSAQDQFQNITRRESQNLLLSSQSISHLENSAEHDVEHLFSNVWVNVGFLIIGMGSLLPWNFIMTLDGYWQYKFRNMSYPVWENGTTHCTQLQHLWTPIQICTSNFSYFIFVFVNAFYFSKFTQNFRVMGPMAVMILFFIVNVVLACIEYETNFGQKVFLAITILIIVIVNMCGAVLVSNLYGISGMFPRPFVMTALLSGEAISSILAAIARIVSPMVVCAIDGDFVACAFEGKYVGNVEDYKAEASIYFVIAIIVLALSIFVYLRMSQIDFYRGYAGFQAQHDETFRENLKEFFNVFMEIWPQILSLFFTFSITIFLYPVSIRIQSNSENNTWSNVYFQSVITFLVFSIFDLIGRQVAGVCLLSCKYPYLICLALLRIIYIPLYLLCDSKSGLYLVKNNFHDGYYILIQITFAFTNGYLMAVCMVLASKKILGARRKRNAGYIMAATRGFGLFVGGLFSLIWSYDHIY